ncbi:unnamed protein product [Pleuronectes platessa]|uniref:Uncharacterized protein n=1 Tax=Pleuronectes platessa TaxID=8262 RepID=A0A9N7YRE5_PLEPL|nr:unnamed protein product [Pleuronectes platessa]
MKNAIMAQLSPTVVPQGHGADIAFVSVSFVSTISAHLLLLPLENATKRRRCSSWPRPIHVIVTAMDRTCGGVISTNAGFCPSSRHGVSNEVKKRTGKSSTQRRNNLLRNGGKEASAFIFSAHCGGVCGLDNNITCSPSENPDSPVDDYSYSSRWGLMSHEDGQSLAMP